MIHHTYFWKHIYIYIYIYIRWKIQQTEQAKVLVVLTENIPNWILDQGRMAHHQIYAEHFLDDQKQDLKQVTNYS